MWEQLLKKNITEYSYWKQTVSGTFWSCQKDINKFCKHVVNRFSKLGKLFWIENYITLMMVMMYDHTDDRNDLYYVTKWAGLVTRLWAMPLMNHVLISSKDKRFYSLLKCGDQFWDPSSLLFNGYREIFSQGVKVAGVQCWPLTSTYCWGQECVEQSLYSIVKFIIYTKI